MRTITAVTVGRSDWGIYRPVLDRIRQDDDLSLRIIAAGAHLTGQSGFTVNDILRDGFDVDDRVEMSMAADTPVGIAKSMGIGVLGFADCYQRNPPDILLLLGDRFEMHSAAVAAVPFGIPLAHIHGGEVSHGAIDDALRHAITKYSHLHFASTAQHAQRIVQLGEEPWRVTVSGAPGLDHLRDIDWLSRGDLERRLNLSLDDSPVIVTFHPVTLQVGETAAHIASLIEAISQIDKPIVITLPNADTTHSLVTQHLLRFCDDHAHAVCVANLGTQAYFSLMREAAVMIGNSSSGIIEAASFALPVINVGIRQAGRSRSENTIDVPCQAKEILAAYQKANSTEFKQRMQSVKNVYGTGNAAEIIVDRLKRVALDDRLRVKQFHDLPSNLAMTSAA